MLLQKLNHDEAFTHLITAFYRLMLLLIADRQNITQQRNNKNNKAFKIIMLFLDGIDYLMSPSQEALHNSFEWPARTPRIRDSDAHHFC